MVFFPKNELYYSEHYTQPKYEAINSSYRFNGKYIRTGACEYLMDDAVHVILSRPIEEMNFVEKKWSKAEWTNRAFSLTSAGIGIFTFFYLRANFWGLYPIREGALKLSNVVVNGASCKYFYTRSKKAHEEMQQWRNPLPEIADLRIKCGDEKKGFLHVDKSNLQGSIVTPSETAEIYRKSMRHYSDLLLENKDYSVEDVKSFIDITSDSENHLCKISSRYSWSACCHLSDSSYHTSKKFKKFVELDQKNKVREDFLKDFDPNNVRQEVYDHKQFLKNFMQKEIEDTFDCWVKAVNSAELY
ncbi:MAG: hypothetical protein VX777_09990 [Chlamydiota bacterium]|nr:hypothetical protein [Chlamydiota bacterium]